MTDEERQELCAELRDPSLHTVTDTCNKAADEIETLDAARLNAEYQRDAALAELKERNAVIEEMAKQIERLTPSRPRS